MTIPIEPTPPTTIGLAPRNADEVNSLIGLHLRNFTDNKATINQDHEYLASTDLKVAPYFFSEEQETLIKSAVADLDASLDAVNMVFISRLTGLF